MKTVSVVMCTYNGEKYLPQQLDSILNQTYPITELYIQDDCSTDSTIEVIQEYQKKYPIIRYSVNSQQEGVNENFYSAVEQATGDYIAFSDQDDVWLLDKIEKKINCIGDSYMCTCFSHPVFYEIDFDVDLDEVNANLVPSNLELMRLSLRGVVAGHNMLMKRELLDLLPHRNYRIYYDLAYAILAAAYGKIAICNEVLCFHRRLESSLTLILEVGEDEGGLKRIFSSLFSAHKKRKDLKEKISKSYSEMYRFLSKINVSSKDLKDAAQLSKLLSKQDIFSTLRAMILCIRRRDELFYQKDKNTLKAIVRAACYPIIHYNYFDYT